VVKNKKKILEEARALGSVGDRYNNIIDWQICTSRYSGFLWKKFHVVTYFEGFFFAVLLIKNLDQLLGISRLKLLLTEP
jgi:hypothetical protein